MAEAYIVGAVRTAGGRNKGRLSGVHPVDLGAQVIDEVVARARVSGEAIDDVIFGCVGQGGAQSANVGRNVVLASGLPESVPGTSIDRQCGSSQQALHFAAQAVMSGTQDLIIAGGVESMTRVPIGSALIDGMKAGHGQPFDAKGFARRYPDFKFNQFTGAEMLAKKYGLTRAELDQLGYESHVKAARATKEGRFAREIVGVEITLEDGSKQVHEVDEGIRFEPSLEKTKALEPLAPGGLLTAATSSQVADGASAVLIASERAVKQHGLTPRARIHGMSVVGSDPVIMLEGPVFAAKRALERAGMKIDAIDLYEINEAFASVPLAWLKGLSADPAKLNVNGGAMALGHPLGATGTKLITTLLHELERTQGRYGLLAICEGGGTANCTLIERLG